MMYELNVIKHLQCDMLYIRYGFFIFDSGHALDKGLFFKAEPSAEWPGHPVKTGGYDLPQREDIKYIC